MKWIKRTTLLVALACGSHAAYALIAHMTLPEQVGHADFIGVVDIRSIRPSASAQLPEDERESMANLQIADAHVLESIKGSLEESRLAISFDDGFACSTIGYKPGSSYLVFLFRNADGSYSNVNWQEG